MCVCGEDRVQQVPVLAIDRIGVPDDELLDLEPVADLFDVHWHASWSDDPRFALAPVLVPE